VYQKVSKDCCRILSSDATSFGIMDLKCNLRADLDTLDVEEATVISTSQTLCVKIYSLDIMRTSVEDSEEEHGVGNLPMEPHGLVKWHPSSFRSKPTKNVSAHRHDDDHGVNRQDKTSTSRYPNGVLKGVQRSQTSVAGLFPPGITVSDNEECGDIHYLPSDAKQGPMEAPKEEMEYEFPWCEEARQHGARVCPHCDE
jgi:hypothetical protein